MSPGPALGRVPIVASIVGLGLVLCSVADALSRATLAPSPWIYWAGVATIVAPIFYRLCSVQASTSERLTLVCMLGLALYLVKLMREPFGFTMNDEFPHAYNVQQILEHHRLFTPSPMLPITSRFPGLEGATSALATITGLSSFGAGIILIGAARLTLMVGLFVLFQAISRSSRIAGLGAAVYAGNSNYLLWGAQFAYESLALALLVVVLACVARRDSERWSDSTAWTVAIVLGIAAIVPTHHLTSYLLDVVLAGLVVGQLLGGRSSRARAKLPLAALGVTLTFAWLVVVASATVGYISPVVSAAFKSTLQTLSGEAPPHALFASAGVASGQSNDLGEQIVAILEVVVLLAALPFGLRVAWRQHRRAGLATLMCLAALGYFGVTALRFVPSAWEIANRSAEFLFVGLAFVVACAPLHRLALRGRRWAGRGLLAVCGSVVVVGGAITGWPANSRTASPIRLAADGGRIESQTLAVGRWAASLPVAAFVAPDADAATITLYGEKKVLTGSAAQADDILAAPTLQSWQLALWRSDHVRYVVVDLRQRGSNNVTGYFFGVRPPAGAIDRLQPTSVATRFDELPAPRIFDSGDILVYDLGAAR